MDTLVLNRSYLPHEVIMWQDAIRLLCLDKAEIVERYDDRFLRYGDHGNNSMNMPAVIRLVEFSHEPKTYKSSQKLCRKTIWLRDDGTCQYCGKTVSLKAMSIDHVIPRSRGGKNIWENVVCSCESCNFYKADRTPREANLHLAREPFAPNIHRGLSLKLHNKINAIRNFPHESWEQHIYWYE